MFVKRCVPNGGSVVLWSRAGDNVVKQNHVAIEHASETPYVPWTKRTWWAKDCVWNKCDGDVPDSLSVKWWICEMLENVRLLKRSQQNRRQQSRLCDQSWELSLLLVLLLLQPIACCNCGKEHNTHRPPHASHEDSGTMNVLKILFFQNQFWFDETMGDEV